MTFQLITKDIHNPKSLYYYWIQIQNCDKPINKKVTMENFAVNSVVGKKGFYGCDFVEVVSIIVKGFVDVKSMNPQDNGKVFKVHIDSVDFI